LSVPADALREEIFLYPQESIERQKKVLQTERENIEILETF